MVCANFERHPIDAGLYPVGKTINSTKYWLSRGLKWTKRRENNVNYSDITRPFEGVCNLCNLALL